MANYHVEGLSDLLDDFEDIASMPDEVIDGMLNAEADIVVKEQKRMASTMLKGPYNKGGVVGSIKKTRCFKAKGLRSIKIEFDGMQHGTRLTEIAFVNEFGKKGQPARPFIKTANEQCADEAVKAAADVLDDYLKSKKL